MEPEVYLVSARLYTSKETGSVGYIYDVVIPGTGATNFYSKQLFDFVAKFPKDQSGGYIPPALVLCVAKIGIRVFNGKPSLDLVDLRPKAKQ